MHTDHKDQSLHSLVERATPGEEVLGSIPAVAARSLLVGSVSVLCDRLREKTWSPALCRAWQHVKFSDVSLGTRLRYSLVVDEDVKKPTKQTLVTIHVVRSCSVTNCSFLSSLSKGGGGGGTEKLSLWRVRLK